MDISRDWTLRTRFGSQMRSSHKLVRMVCRHRVNIARFSRQSSNDIDEDVLWKLVYQKKSSFVALEQYICYHNLAVQYVSEGAPTLILCKHISGTGGFAVKMGIACLIDTMARGCTKALGFVPAGRQVCTVL